MFADNGYTDANSVKDYIQIFSLEIIGEIMKTQIKCCKTTASERSLSENDLGIIHYITGYVARALKKSTVKTRRNAN